MKIIILKDNLKEGLNSVIRAVSENNNLPILKNILIKTFNNKILIFRVIFVATKMGPRIFEILRAIYFFQLWPRWLGIHKYKPAPAATPQIFILPMVLFRDFRTITTNWTVHCCLLNKTKIEAPKGRCQRVNNSASTFKTRTKREFNSLGSKTYEVLDD